MGMAPRPWLASRPWLTDAAAAAGAAAVFLVFQFREEPDDVTPWLLVLIALQTLPLALRRRAPWPVLLAVTVGYALYRSTDPMLSLGPLFQAVAVYSVARHTTETWSRAAPVVATVGMLVPEYLVRYRVSDLGPVELVVLDAVLVLALFATLWKLGASQRRIRADADALRDLTVRLRAEKEVSAERAAAAERARIARDLHDIVAHHVSAIAVQARATAEIVTPDARHGIERIGTTADAALEEMRRMIGLLATGPDDEPSLAHLDRLTAAIDGAGGRVTLVADDSATTAPQAVQVSAYRILQEALTNVLKHAGPTDVGVELRREPTALVLTVRNGCSGSANRPVGGAGMGLIGMRERVAVFGGSLHAGPLPEGGWLVRATLPFGAPA